MLKKTRSSRKILNVVLIVLLLTALFLGISDFTTQAIQYDYVVKNSMIYSRIEPFHEGRAFIVTTEADPRYKGSFILRYGLIDTNGKLIVPYLKDIDNIGYFQGGRAIVMTNDKRGYIDRNGKLVISKKYDTAENFCEGYAHVGIRIAVGIYLYGFINDQGAEVVPLIYSDAGDFHEGLAYVQDSKGKYGFVDAKGQVIVPMIYDEVRDFSEGITAVRVGNRWGYIDAKGEVVLDFQFQCAGAKSGGLMFVNATETPETTSNPDVIHLFSHFKCINPAGETVIPDFYSDYGGFSHGLAVISDYNSYKKGTDLFLINQKGQSVLDVSGYSVYGMPNEGRINVYKPGVGRGYLDMDGKEVIPCQYEYATDFKEGLAIVENDKGERAVIDREGNILLPFGFGFISEDGINDGLLCYYNEQKNEDGINTVYSVIRNPLVRNNAVATDARILVDGAVKQFEAYIIGGATYFRLRDVAYVLNGTGKQFSVGWDGSEKLISLGSAQPYTAIGGEMALPSRKVNNQAILSTVNVYLDGKPKMFTQYVIGGYTYFKLRDLGMGLNFGVMWDEVTKTIHISSTQGYIDAQ